MEKLNLKNQLTKTPFLILFVILISVGVTSAYAINITLGGTVDITQILNMMGNRITNVGTPTASTDAATKGYVDQSPTTDTLAVLGCTTDQIAKFDGDNWVCAVAPTTPTVYQNSATSTCGTNCASIACDSGDTVLGGGVGQSGGIASAIHVAVSAPTSTGWTGILEGGGAAKTTVICSDTAAPFRP